MKKRLKIIFSLSLLAILSFSCTEKPDYYKVVDGQFIHDGSPYYFIGTNFWYGSILASDGEGGDRARLSAELDTLKSIGLTNLRIMVGSDGENGVPSKVEPTLQKSPGNYNDTLLRGLDYMMCELGKRGMSAVLFLNNAWEWTGGYGQYLEWAGYGKAPIPNIDGWDKYHDYVSQFIRSDSAKALFSNYVKYIVGRKNGITGKPYSEDPAIFSWQIGNEPRVFNTDSASKAEFVDWLRSTAKLIKGIDGNHMVSIGSEGYHGCEDDWNLYESCCSIPEIDYINMHIWPYNWGWIDRTDPAAGVTEDDAKSIDSTNAYMEKHLEIAARVKKPLVCEEFGYPRDGFSFSPGSATAARDAYYSNMFGHIVKSGKEGGYFAGCNFWGWGGLAKARHTFWEKGDDYTGDPAQEQQGLNSVFATDTSTLDVIRRACSRLQQTINETNSKL
ncbi:MAG: beta-mannosidase [Bacteroidales bacterium]|jgi:mannan endo-1,4-beta-mannosidase|nr:beta-mannosidase [Bacteroidales bacterium]MCI2121488.1 beta-mannosidase [Bacteroidales bacterium]MCI2145147.1 beta-mannosidase [Bacteroidales bacterium]